jgi:phosphoglucosamine mutase
LCDGFVKYPQVLIGIPVKRKPELSTIPEISNRIAQIESTLSETGRIVVRYSGTESVARIMIEGPEHDSIDRMARDLGEIIKTKLN